MNQHAVDCPVARWDNLVIDDIGEDTLVYDQASHVIHQLNQGSASVWRLCDGTRSVADLSEATGLTSDAVHVALEKLADANLLVGTLPVDQPLPSQSRRSFMKRSAMAGAIPAIVSISAPLAVRATSQGGEPCGTGGLTCGENQHCCGSQLCCRNDYICQTSPSVTCKCPNGSFPCGDGTCCQGSLVCVNNVCVRDRPGGSNEVGGSPRRRAIPTLA